ncbi:hypothetical protein B0H21DRAFT_859540 [Amylocystis lapponica]|nr:hypothetical protein B0H21DRAFT_859540 [Amylocystis lapponica]
MPYYPPPADDQPSPLVRHRRTRSSTNFSDERGPGAFVSLGSLPRSHKKALFHITVNDDDDRDDSPRHSPTRHRASRSRPTSPRPPSRSPPRLPFHLPTPPPLLPFRLAFCLRDHIIPSSHPFHSHHPLQRQASQALSKVFLLFPNIAGLFPFASKHFRAQSAPTTPSGQKNVHFAEDSGLETETETETEAEQTSFPFPSISSTPTLYETDPSSARTSTVPALEASLYAHVHLETLSLPRVHPPALRGTVVVRNVAFEKRVVVRFTLDDWQTTSEVACHHVVSLPSLPPPFPQPRTTIGDLAASIAAGVPPPANSPGNDTRTWDRFSFTIRLEDYEHKLAERTLYLAVRYAPGSGGEYWDNNGGANFRVGFRRASLSPTSSTLPPPVHAQQRTFSAPSTLRTTPTTVAADAPSTLVRSPSFQFPAGPQSQAPPRSTSFPAHSQSSPARAFVARHLSLSNYVPPSTTPSKSLPVSLSEANANTVTPPMTPPGSTRVRSSSLPTGASLRADTPTLHEAELEDHTLPSPEPSPSPEEGILSPLDFWGPEVGAAAESGFAATLGLGIEFPASMEGVGMVGQLLSPPSSPVPGVAMVRGEQERQNERHNEIDDHDENYDEHDEQEGMQHLYDERSHGQGFQTDSSYAALIQQWCFGGVGGGVVQPNTPGHGQAQGYGFPGWGFGLPDAGMVGGARQTAISRSSSLLRFPSAASFLPLMSLQSTTPRPEMAQYYDTDDIVCSSASPVWSADGASLGAMLMYSYATPPPGSIRDERTQFASRVAGCSRSVHLISTSRYNTTIFTERARHTPPLSRILIHLPQAQPPAVVLYLSLSAPSTSTSLGHTKHAVS